MKRVHIISAGDSYMCRMAAALKIKGYEVSCSGVESDAAVQELTAKGIWLGELSCSAALGRPTVDYVVPSLRVAPDHPEVKKAKEQGFLVMPFPDFVLRMTKDKIRVVVGDGKHPLRILSMIHRALSRQNMICDYVVLDEVNGCLSGMSLGYDARMVLLQASDACLFGNRPLYYAYRPHILLLPESGWTASDVFPTPEAYAASRKELVASIERDGKLIYNQDNPLLQELAESVREDITALPYTLHKTVEESGDIRLDTRYGLFPVGRCDDEFLYDLNAARLTSRQLGVNDKDFYPLVSGFAEE